MKKQRTMKKEVKQETNTIVSPLTADEQAIADRVSKQDTEWFTIREDELHDFSLMNDPLELPKAAAKLQREKRYAFRWCKREPSRVDQLTRSVQPPLKWAIVNKTNLPELEDQVDETLGCVCCLDQLLLFKPWHHHALVKQAKADLANNQDNSGSLKSRERKSDGQIQYRSSVRSEEGGKPSEAEIRGTDVVMADEAIIDAAMGIQEDRSDLGDLIVAE